MQSLESEIVTSNRKLSKSPHKNRKLSNSQSLQFLVVRVVLHGKRTREISIQKNQNSDFFVRRHTCTESGQLEWWDRGRCSTHSCGIYFYFPSRIKFFFFRGGEIQNLTLKISKKWNSKIRILIFACPDVRASAVRGQKN